jgi:hypothetical protein
MNRSTLKAAGEALWGPQYRSEMARQLDVHLRTVMRWDSGETSIPPSAWARLGKLLRERKHRIDQVLGKIEVSS